MNKLDTREWLLTNGLGSMSSGTICDARTRTYHGWLIAALNPPGNRTLLLSHFDASLEIAGKIWALATNFWDSGKTIDPLGYQWLRSFEINPIPTWIWGSEDWQLTRAIQMPYGIEKKQEVRGERQDNISCSIPQFCHRITIKYQYEGNRAGILRLRPLICDRDFHQQQIWDETTQFSQLVSNQRLYLQSMRQGKPGTPWHLQWSGGYYQPDGIWYWNYYYPEENQRGLGDREDLYSPGYLTVMLQPGETVIIEARVGCPHSTITDLNSQTFDRILIEEETRQNQLLNQKSKLISHSSKLFDSPLPDKTRYQLLKAGDSFIAYRTSSGSPTVIAGYPWFKDWGRYTLISLPGLALATGRFTLAKGLLKTLANYCHNGLMPNTFPHGSNQPIYNSIDTSLWWLESLGLYLETTQDWDFLIQQYPLVRKIYKAYTAGTNYQIQVDATDGLLTWDAPDVAITWMDVVLDGKPITPRRGKPVEINALWYSGLSWLCQWTEKMVIGAVNDRLRLMHQSQHYQERAAKVKASLQKFWHPELNYFYDTIEPDDRPDGTIRPNAIIALSLYHCGFPEEQARQVLQVARNRLLTPYGLRSLDPGDPNYIGKYNGDRNHRDRAYHQGTVWSWLIGPFTRAWHRFYPTEALPFDWQPLLEHFQQQACLGSISELFDGDYPHHPQGAISQAAAVAELIRYFSQTGK
ncbi:MAG TPA: amylo-alpha-1,6-glucosidase [Cyanobacteria bacterium UBA11149]|nr:amylo-alpha-1,6-glucosidase [Cyanobacteria bacterium UBA11367]HBE56867.1 amylo-alpha-1,6-glucosidase [Cyanobacteria bacterium UBA11366]HBK64789.1 amylo-alpha-1,6-glucosidase [Cyanobacteria bacterium UBA11166]HBR76003.1 amylo-alpha-1,6-glucosidase [Cyanobacteria bacterium UBA11159]HBS72114.1 amylo-alpha-1,6-glucosidase [Cyanobacteria bacterium UBA11153]HBW87523.1 amylo-alpha-1,6-glucosidase [Cyanobacteria bacterium UBA11149]HCA96259.1 amylo-alpha-1,6-glucosidase [Cyanobacteria bacterium UBA